MLIPPQVFTVSKCCDSLPTKRYAIDCVRLERDADGPIAVATDGCQLLVIRWREDNAAEYPNVGIGDCSPVADFTALIPSKQWNELVRLPPKKSPKSILLNAVVCEKPIKGQITVGATDLSDVRTLPVQMPEGHYPPWRDCVPSRKPHEEVCIAVNSAILSNILVAMKCLTPHNSHRVTLHVPLDSISPIVITADDLEGTKSVGVIVPLNPEKMETDSALREERKTAVALEEKRTPGSFINAALPMLSEGQLESLYTQLCEQPKKKGKKK